MRRLSLVFIIVVVFVASTNIQESPHGEMTFSCTDCHTTEGWKMIEGTYSFNHIQTNFPLEGQHSSTDCKDCHKTLVFSAAEQDCFSCHTDIHEQTVGNDCASCHNSNAWIVTNMKELHLRSRFPLLGAHAVADCYDCHKSENPLRFDPLGIECFDCHQANYNATRNPNHVQENYSTNCIDCHSMHALTWSNGGIIHDFFPLVQGHEINDCYQCHTQGLPYSEISNDCFSCHSADYNATTNPSHLSSNLSKTCTDCHTLAPGWKPAKFTQHDPLYFPIYSGKHNGEWNSCMDCHAQPSNYAVFSCIDCHEHSRTRTDDHHDEVNNYTYTSNACLDCHPRGYAD